MDAYGIHMPGFACGAAGSSDGKAAERGRDLLVTERSEGAGRPSTLVAVPMKEAP